MIGVLEKAGRYITTLDSYLLKPSRRLRHYVGEAESAPDLKSAE